MWFTGPMYFEEEAMPIEYHMCVLGYGAYSSSDLEWVKAYNGEYF